MQIVFVLLLLAQLLGWVPVAVGMVLLLCLLPLAAWLNIRISRTQARMYNCTDARVKLISEASRTKPCTHTLTHTHARAEADIQGKQN